MCVPGSKIIHREVVLHGRYRVKRDLLERLVFPDQQDRR